MRKKIDVNSKTLFKSGGISQRRFVSQINPQNLLKNTSLRQFNTGNQKPPQQTQKKRKRKFNDI